MCRHRMRCQAAFTRTDNGSFWLEMTGIRAFVGHSFLAQDEALVRTFTDYFNTLKRGALEFDWDHATEARPEEVSAKVLELIEDKNVFIGICTRNERAIKDSKLSARLLGHCLSKDSDLEWKTSDWIIQEIGLAIGRGMHCCLLVERGVRKPGGLQGNLEYIEFNRSSPEKAFPKILEMLTALKNKSLSSIPLHGTEMGSASPKATSPKEEATLLNDPDSSWGEERYRTQYMFATIVKDHAHASKISIAFRNSPFGSDGEAAIRWLAFCELQNVRWNEGVSLEKLKELAKSNEGNVFVQESLAKGYAHFQDFNNAERHLRNAIARADTASLKMNLLGDLLEILQKSGNVEAVERVVSELKSLAVSPDQESEVLRWLSEVPSWYKHDLIKAAIIERRLVIDPTDISARFQVAYLHSQMGSDPLAMYHYEKVPSGSRNGMVWNNLGVVYQAFSLPAMAVGAYRSAIAKKETLAMSNIAYLYMGAGFIHEAKEIVELAQKEENYHKNIASALVRLKEVPDEEEKLHHEKLEGVAEKSSILARFGELLMHSIPNVFPHALTDDKCELKVVCLGASFSALGSYREERSQQSGVGAFGTISAGEEFFTVAYTGQIFGSLVVGERTIERTGGASPSLSIFGLYPIKSQFAFPLPGLSSEVDCLLGGRPSKVQLLY
jgi:tetratricopeptide (TPR) repeat protein